jgi:hypothetical protein
MKSHIIKITIASAISFLVGAGLMTGVMAKNTDRLATEHGAKLAEVAGALEKNRQIDVVRAKQDALVREGNDLDDIASFTEKGSVQRIFIVGKMQILRDEAKELNKQLNDLK